MNSDPTAIAAVQAEIQALIDRESRAWDACDAETLVQLFHPDTVWPWPPTSDAHDPIHWIMPLGRFNAERWKNCWNELFRSHTLVHNVRTTERISVTEQHDGAFAIVDVDTLWRHKHNDALNHWQGRACKVYTKVNRKWLFIHQTGLLRYP
jgi:ketosteroid isomerase-like protein